MVEPTDRLANLDFGRHNAEVKEVWDAFNAGRPIRTPIIFGINARYYMPIPDANPDRIGFREYTENPDVMCDLQLRFARWSRFNLLQDVELGPPEHWQIGVDCQNYYEAAWFGCPIEYFADQVPDTRPIFADAPERVMDNGIPDPFGGFMGRAREYVEHFRDRAERETYLDRPISVGVPCTGTDGPMTVACNLFGAAFVCAAMASEPERLHTLLDFITEATIRRLRAWREYAGIPVPQEGFGMADDSIALISTPMYREHILPYHRRIVDAFATPGPRSMHLCGDATRHFATIRDELNVQSFDTGFPVDFAWLRRELGPEVRVWGGPHADRLRSQTPEWVREDVRRIMESGILEGGLFVLREGNNLAPHTPLENTEALYHAGREFGCL
jgi:uroporphyrinogen-III decarboxylase